MPKGLIVLLSSAPRCVWSPASCGWRSGIERPHAEEGRRLRLRLRQRPLRRARPRPRRRRRRDHPRLRQGHERRRAARPRRRRLRRLHGGAARRPAATGSSAAGSPAAARSWASASACRSSSRRGIEHGVETEGLDEWPGTVEPLKAPVVPHMGWNTVEAPADSRAVRRPGRRRPLLLRALLRRARLGAGGHQPGHAAPQGHLGHARRAVRGRRGERRRCGPPSSTPRSPATPEPSC